MLGRAYFRLFYQKMLENELSLSGIKPGMNAVHVGCGPLPLTAVFLAGHGVRVTAFDLSHDILKLASGFISYSGLDNMIHLVKGCGTDVDFSGYDAVWLSLHVRPLDRIIHRALMLMNPEARIIFRLPRGKISMFYRDIDQTWLSRGVKRGEIKQPLGKISLMLKNT